MTFQLIFDGPALESNEFEVTRLTSALLAMDSLLKRADGVLNSGKTSLRMNVRASFKTGSFQIEFSSLQTLIDQARELFASPTANAVVNAVGIFSIVFGAQASLVRLVKFLHGRAPDRIVDNRDGTLTVYRSDVSEKYERRTIELYRDYQVRQAFEELVADQLGKDGIDSIAVAADGTEVVASIQKDEAEYFRCPPAPEQEIGTSEYETSLNLVRITFKEGNKWRVTDGRGEFSVTVSDEDFLRRVEANEPFSKGDILRVRLRQVQYSTPKGIVTESFVTRVLEHIKPPTQLNLGV